MADGEARAGPAAIEGEAAATGPEPIVLLHAGVADELRRFVLGVVRDPGLADDVMQATFIKALEHGHEARAETARGWLFRVAFHEALAARRREASHDKGRRKLAESRPGSMPAPEDRLIRGEAVEAVREAIRRLPEEQRRVVLARVYDEKTFAEIARESGLPLGTVLTRMRRALEKLRRTMTPGA